MKLAAVLITIGLLLTGCTAISSRVAVLQNPQTKQTVECRVDPWGDFNHKKQVDICIDAYQKAGYVLLVDSLKP